jgi:hypothetical protein
MKRSTKVPVPGLTLLFFGMSFVVAALALLYLLDSRRGWTPDLRLPQFPTRTQESAKATLKVKVWVDKSTGIYYCPDSPMYGHSESGAYIAQGEAVQTGYSPALGEPCQ